MRVSDKQLLKAVRAGLKRLAADTANPHLVSAIELAVGELAARADGRAESLRVSSAEAKRLALRAAALAGRIGADGFSARAQALATPGTSELPALEAAYQETKQLLVDSTLRLGEALAAGAGDAAWRGEVAGYFHELARHDAARAAQDAAVPSLDAEESQDAEVPIEQRLRRYFATCRGNDELRGPFALLEAKPLAGGFSRQTILARVRDALGKEWPLVIRKQVPNGFLDGACNTLAEELPYFRLGFDNGLPVPRLHWHETDAAYLGGEFFVTQCMPGATIGSSYQMAEGIGEAFFRQLAEIMARLHCLDWTSCTEALCAGSRIPSGVEPDYANATLAMVRQFEDYWRRAELEPLPTMEMLADWLKRNAPPNVGRAVLCHGDIGFHNLLVQDGRITALLDWETSRLGDPARDLSYLRPVATQYVAWGDFLSWYRAAGGPEVSQESLDYHAVFAAFAHVIVCDVALGNSFPRAELPNLEYLRLGLPIKAHFMNELLETSGAVWGAPPR